MSITRRSALRVAIAAALALPLFPVAQASAAAVAVPAAKAIVRIPLSSKWKVTAYSQLKFADGTMTCTWRSLTRVAPKAATAVALNCTGAKNAYGMAYSLTLSRPALHLSKKVSVRFPRFQPATVASLLKYAPLEVPVSGVAATLGNVSMVGPAGWARKVYPGDAINYRNPGFDSVNAQFCDLWVLKAVTPDPNAFAAGLSDAKAERLLEIQLVQATQPLFGPTPLTGPYGNADQFHNHRYGTIGAGHPFVSVTLDAAGVTVRTTMIIIPTAKYAVGVIVIENGDLCQPSYKYGVSTALLLQSIKYAGQLVDLHAYDKQILGMWGSTDGHLAVADVFGANGHYVFAYSSSGAININGSWYDATYSFAGDGMYSVLGPVISFFPLKSGRAASSQLFYVYREFFGTSSSRHMCRIATGTNPATFMSCNSFWR
jgi:hypothetical protein